MTFSFLRGVTVVLNDTILSARDATKTNTYRVQTFQGRDLGPLGYADADGKVVFYHSPARKHTTQTEFDVRGLDDLPRVDVVVSYIGADGTMIDAAVAAGTRTPRIILRHILPNTLAPITVQATYICASAMIVEAILSFIGAGTPPIIPSWGNIMAEGRALWQVKPYIVFFPAVFLSLTVLAVNLLGDGLRDALDPRLAKRL